MTRWGSQSRLIGWTVALHCSQLLGVLSRLSDKICTWKLPLKAQGMGGTSKPDCWLLGDANQTSSARKIDHVWRETRWIAFLSLAPPHPSPSAHRLFLYPSPKPHKYKNAIAAKKASVVISSFSGMILLIKNITKTLTHTPHTHTTELKVIQMSSTVISGDEWILNTSLSYMN